MKKVVFIISHLFSGSNSLLETLNQNPRIQIRDTGFQYNHPSNLDNLFSMGHKLNNTAAIYGDHLLHNISLTSKSFYSFCKFIYVINSAKPTLNLLFNSKKFNELNSLRYYAFRLRRIAEMAKSTPGAILLTANDLKDNKGKEIISNYLNLKDSLNDCRMDNIYPDILSSQYVKKADESYEKYLYYLKTLPLQRV